MREVVINIDDASEVFYSRLAQNANVPIERVLEDALFNYAGAQAINAFERLRHSGGNVTRFPQKLIKSVEEYTP